MKKLLILMLFIINIAFAQEYDDNTLQFYPTQASSATMDPYSHMFVYTDVLPIQGLFTFTNDKNIEINIHDSYGKNYNLYLQNVEMITKSNKGLVFQSNNIILYIYDDAIVVQAPLSIIVLYK